MDDATRRSLHLGRELFSRNALDEAFEHLQTVLASGEATADVHHMVGVILHDRRAFADAKSHFEKALALNPEYTEAALNLAITCNDLGLYGASREVSATLNDRARRGDRIEPYARGKLANLHAEVARAYDELGLFDEAVSEYRRALVLAPTFSDLRVRLAMALRRDGDLDGALSELETCLQLTPEYTAARVKYGFALSLAGRVEEARAQWEEVLRRDPDERTAATYLGMVREGATHLPSVLPPAMVAEGASDEEFQITVLKGKDE